MSSSRPREFLLDVSRLIWRTWNRRLPTGIDRVCLQYVERLGARAQAVIQFKGSRFVLSPANSDRLFRLLGHLPRCSRARLLGTISKALATAKRSPPAPNMFYLNVGHTGLHEPTLPAWIAEHDLRAIYLIHDLIPLTHPQFCRSGEATKHAVRMKAALASASGIVGNSQSTLDELAAFAVASSLPMPPHVVAWLSGKPPPPARPARQFERPHFVTVGTIEARKNHILLLQIWRRLIREMGDAAPRLIIVGQRGWEAEEALTILDSARELEGHVLELGHCGDAELDEIVGAARALLMPSFVEGFGLPVLEALQLGTPVVASDLPVYRDIVADIPTYLDPNDAGAWEDAIRSFMNDGPERVRQRKAMENLRSFSWDEHFEIVERWLQAL